MVTICRSPSSEPASRRRTHSHASGSIQCLNSAQLRSARLAGEIKARTVAQTALRHYGSWNGAGSWIRARRRAWTWLVVYATDQPKPANSFEKNARNN